MTEPEATIEEIKRDTAGIRKGYENCERDIAAANEVIKRLQDENYELQRSVDDIRRSRLSEGQGPDISRGRFVSRGCAAHIASIAIVGAQKHGKLSHVEDSDTLVAKALDNLGMQQRAALTTSDIPLPQAYSSEVVELVWMYGQARKYGTVYPLGAGTVNLPKLKTSPAFGFMDMSTAIPEKSPQFENETFTAEKAGGIIRIPSELDVDSIVPLGEFLARYIAREMAKFEDVVYFTADGTSTYKSMKGMTKAALDAGNNVTLTTGNVAPSDITLADLRLMRSKISTAAYGQAAYYMNATMEALLVTFNSATNSQVYIPNSSRGPTLDGFPIRWVDVLPVYDESEHLDQLQACFGAAEYHWLGTRGEVRIDTSSEVYFASDQLAVRALERFKVALMADDAVSVLQLAAAAS